MKTIQLALLFLTTLFFSSLANAKTWRVNRDSDYNGTNLYGSSVGGTADFPVFREIDHAIDYPDVDDGDTLHIEGNTNAYGSFTLHKRLVLIGAGYFHQENSQTSATGLASVVLAGGSSIVDGGQGSVVQGIDFIKSNWFWISTSNIIIERCRFSDYAMLGINSGNVSNIIIRQNFFEAFENRIVVASSITNLPSGIFINNNIIRCQIEFPDAVIINEFNNNVLDPQNTITTFHFNAGSFRNNILRNSLVTYEISAQDASYNIIPAAIEEWTAPSNIVMTALQQTNNLFVPASANSTDGDYQLQQEFEQDTNLGSDGTQRGAFGGNTPYSLSGVGPIPIVYSLNTNGTSSPDSGLNITISTRVAH